ncbi:ABC transporter substrate-binding protein [Cellulomonas sp. 73-92]|uniref:ABC transporter substrate-binding protein n=1 Tax=Cellulomonas sp. 73-92 TaxID=1895740 RepID=UPI000A6BD5CF|nr:ABC transporter substrate-binding protein [Cellulomonas sp. 73-92]
MKLVNRHLAAASIVVAALALAACSSSPSTATGTTAPAETTGAATSEASATAAACASISPFEFQLQQPPNGSNAGFAAGVEEGFYKNHCLDVKIIAGTGSSTTAQMVASGKANIGYADSAATTQLIAKGAPLVVVGTILQSNPNEVIAFKSSGISSIADLKGKKVGTPIPSSQASMLPLFFAANGLKESDVTLVNIAATSLTQSLLQHQVDAILGSIDTYQVQVQAQSTEPLFTAMFADHGVATVSTSIFANKDWAAKNADAVKAFVAGSLEGWAFAAKNPQKSVDDLTTLWGAGEPSKTSLQELQATLDGNLLCANGAKYLGKATPDAWTKTQDLLSSVGLLDKGVDPTKYYTYDYLPPDNQLPVCPLS